LRNAEHARIKLAARNLGINEANIKIRGKQTSTEILAAAEKRGKAKTVKQMRNGAIQRIKDMALNAGIGEKYVKYNPKLSSAVMLNAAKKRKNISAKKDKRGMTKRVLLALLQQSGVHDISETDIKSAFCVRAK
jgi:hypothetical protein